MCHPAQEKENEVMATLTETFKSAVKAQVGGNTQHGWGLDDSLEVIMAVIANENGSERKDYKDSELEKLIRRVINPSQYRQTIEGTEAEVKEGKALLVKQESRKSKVEKMLWD